VRLHRLGRDPLRVSQRVSLPLGSGASRATGLSGNAERDRHAGRPLKFIARARQRTNPFRLMGFGHRVYKITTHVGDRDERSATSSVNCGRAETTRSCRLPKNWKKQALEDPYFEDKKLFPNVDFLFSAFILEAMGFPTSMVTRIFALFFFFATTVGWDFPVERN